MADDYGGGFTGAAKETGAGITSNVNKATGGIQGAEDWEQKNIEAPVHNFIGKIPVIGGIDQMINGTGAFAPQSTGLTDSAASDANNVRNGFVGQYGALQKGAAPVMNGAQQSTAQGDQSRALQQGAAAPMQQGLGTMGIGTGIQQQGLGAQQQGIGIQQQGLGAMNMGLRAQNQGLAQQQVGAGTLGNAAASYQGVLSGSQPSVAQLSANRLQGQNIASMYGGAASARGVDRAGALRAAINGAGAANTQGAANAGILRAQEMDAARSGLAGVGGAQVGAGSAMSGTGSAMGGIGSGVSGLGQGITAGGQGISQTGAGLVNSGTQQVGAGTALGNLATNTRGQDITQANDQATLDQQTGANNLTSAINTNGQNITQQNNLGTLALGAQKNEQDAANAAIEQQRKSAEQGQKNANGALGMVGGLIKSLF